MEFGGQRVVILQAWGIQRTKRDTVVIGFPEYLGRMPEEGAWSDKPFWASVRFEL